MRSIAQFFTQIYIKLFCQFRSWTNLVNSGKFMDNCWISCQVIADMKKSFKTISWLLICTQLTFHGYMFHGNAIVCGKRFFSFRKYFIPLCAIIAYVTNSQWGRENFIADILKLFSHQSLSRNHVLEMHVRGVGGT